MEALPGGTMDRTASSQFPPTGPSRSARQDVRLAAPAELRCTLRGAPAIFTMNNISAGGFGASVNMPLGRDTVYEFEFHFHDMRVLRRARVIHCAWIDGNRWKVGAAFEPDDSEPTIEQLIDRITGSALNFA
jgi:hypothetical protein